MSDTGATRETVDAYTQAWIRGNIDEAATHLAEHLCFRGSIDHFDRAAPFIEALRGFRALVTEVNLLSHFYDGPEAALLYDCETTTEAGTIRTAEFFHVDRGRIDSIRLVFDATVLRRAMGEQA